MIRSRTARPLRQAAATPSAADGLRGAYAEHAAACLALARAVLADPRQAENAVQAAFVELSRTSTSPSSVRAWLLARTHRHAVERLRGQPPGARSVLVPDHPALSALLPEQHQALTLAYWGGRTDQEIASRAGVPVEVARKHLRDSLRTLSTSRGSAGSA